MIRRQRLRPARVERPEIKRRQWLRAKVKDLAQGMCARCGRFDAKGEADHVQELWENGTDALDNMQWLCRHCHKAKTVSRVPLRAKADRLAARTALTKRRKPMGQAHDTNSKR